MQSDFAWVVWNIGVYTGYLVTVSELWPIRPCTRTQERINTFPHYKYFIVVPLLINVDIKWLKKAP